VVCDEHACVSGRVRDASPRDPRMHSKMGGSSISVEALRLRWCRSGRATVGPVLRVIRSRGR
jgi:hypothetical protein